MRTPRERIRLRDRTGEGTPLISIITPCFNQGHYLLDGRKSVTSQTYPQARIEHIIVDDGSDDPHTVRILDDLEQEGSVTLVRPGVNRGLGAALNAGIEHASGRYILPFDSDNRLLPLALSELVHQLNVAPHDIGFIYPIVQFFGNRHDVFEPPDYNLFTLLQGNYADSCSLIDADVFAAGVRYPAGVFREDWNLWMELAKHGIYGQRARARTYMYRKRGFNRSDLVSHRKAGAEVDESVRSRHPEYFGSARRYAAVKADWLPALSLVALAPLGDRDERGRLWSAAERQTCIDAELILPGEDWPAPIDGPSLIGMPMEGDVTVRDLLTVGAEIARGRFLLVTETSGRELLEDPSFIEKLLRRFMVNPRLQTLLFTGDQGLGVLDWQLIRNADAAGASPHTVAWAIDRLSTDQGINVAAGPIAKSLGQALSRANAVEWRWYGTEAVDRALDRPLRLHLPSQPLSHTAIGPIQAMLEDLPVLPRDSGAAVPTARRLAGRALLPGVPDDAFRQGRNDSWVPPQSQMLYRHVDPQSGMRAVTNQRASPTGFRLELVLGTTRLRPLPGTLRLDAVAAATSPGVRFIASDERAQRRTDAVTLGFIEEASLPMLAPLRVARSPKTGQRTLVVGIHEDALTREFKVERHLGFIEPSPLLPRTVTPSMQRPGSPGARVDLVGLVRSIDLDAWRHRYGAGAVPDGRLAGELGSLCMEPVDDGCPLYQSSDGFVFTQASDAARPSPLRAVGRWVVSPIRWNDVLDRRKQLELVGRRAATVLQRKAHGSGHGHAGGATLLGYLYAHGGRDRSPLYSALHPVTGDQLLTIWQSEADKLGYGPAVLLGYLHRHYPVTGASEAAVAQVPVPWGWKLGRPAEAVRPPHAAGPDGKAPE